MNRRKASLLWYFPLLAAEMQYSKRIICMSAEGIFSIYLLNKRFITTAIVCDNRSKELRTPRDTNFVQPGIAQTYRPLINSKVKSSDKRATCELVVDKTGACLNHFCQNFHPKNEKKIVPIRLQGVINPESRKMKRMSQKKTTVLFGLLIAGQKLRFAQNIYFYALLPVKSHFARKTVRLTILPWLEFETELALKINIPQINYFVQRPHKNEITENKKNLFQAKRLFHNSRFTECSFLMSKINREIGIEKIEPTEWNLHTWLELGAPFDWKNILNWSIQQAIPLPKNTKF